MGSQARKLRLTRRVTFSSGHRYWLANLDARENRELFGEWASPYSHGHNYALEVTVAGSVDRRTGMVVNIKDIDEAVRENVVEKFDGKSLNDEVEYFKSHAPSVESLLAHTRDLLVAPGIMPQDAELVALKLEETENLYGELMKQGPNWKTSITRTYEFAAAHRLHSDALSAAENIELFGKCNNPSGHGHNFVLEVTVEGEPDPRTGMIANIVEIDRVVNERVVDYYDHKNLNCDIPEFGGKVVTSEVLVEEIFDRLKGALPAKLKRVRLYETARSAFEVSAD